MLEHMNTKIGLSALSRTVFIKAVAEFERVLSN